MFRFTVKGAQTTLRTRIRQYNTSLVANRPSEATIETLSFIPEYKDALESCKAENWDKAVQEIERAIAVCNNAMGQTSPQVVYLNRLMLDICYASQHSMAMAVPYAESLAKRTIAAGENDVTWLGLVESCISLLSFCLAALG